MAVPTIRERWRSVFLRRGALCAAFIALLLVPVSAGAADADADGMADEFESFFGLNPATNDAAIDDDADGLDNLAESARWTDPFVADTDRDGFSDAGDSNPVSRACLPWGDSCFIRTNDILYTWPGWLIAAFKLGGEWVTNPAVWHVSAADSNDALLNMDVDRALLTNDLIMNLGYMDHSNASLYLDLCDTNDAVISSNLFDNLLIGSGAGTNRLITIPLESYSNAVVIRLRRGTGEVTVTDTLLYVDKDGDGLDADQERQLGTSDLALDSDGDLFSDHEEVFTYGTDPASSLSVPYGSIAGLITYAGIQTGTVHVVAAFSAQVWTSSWTTVLGPTALGPYAISTFNGQPLAFGPAPYSVFAPLRHDCFLRAYRDVNGNGIRDHWEPCGLGQPSLLTLATATTGSVAIALADPDNDNDGLSDILEMGFGKDPFASNAYVGLPFVEGFETNTVTLGALHGQNGWEAQPAGGAIVQTNVVYDGAQALQIAASNDPVTVRHLFAASTSTVVWADILQRPYDAAISNITPDGASCLAFAAGGRLHVYDGHKPDGQGWIILTNHVPIVEGEWVRLTIRNDYAAQQWLICLDGVKLAEGLGFARPTAGFSAVSFTGERGFTDNIRISATIPDGISIDGDTLPDNWEVSHFGTSTAGEADDPDHDGLTNLQEFDRGTNPMNPDTDGDGVNDGLEVHYDADPARSNLYSRLPFLEFFETNTVTLGELNGQHGWQAAPLGRVSVQTNDVCEGRQAMGIRPAVPNEDGQATVRHVFAASEHRIIWADMAMRTEPCAKITSNVTVAALCGFMEGGYLWAYDGHRATSNAVVCLTNVPPCASSGWARVTLKLDYDAQEWLVCVDGLLAAQGLGFASPVPYFSSLSMTGEKGGGDAFTVGTNQPPNLSLDGDSLSDDWELQHFWNLSQTDTGDPDEDGATNLQECRAGSDPAVPDTDADGMPDGWELAAGLNPVVSTDAGLDADGDGLSNAAECQFRTDALAPDSDLDGLSDGAEVNVWNSNPLVADTDGDGFKDGDEVERGTDPADAGSHPASHWRSRVKVTLRDGILTNTLFDVPVLVKLTPERIDYAQCSVDGRDLLVTDATGLPLAFEIEAWNPGGESLLWVRLPELGGTNAVGHFWVHWNNPDATNAAVAAAVWPAGYLGVWHLAQTNTVLADSTLGAYAATNVGAICTTGFLGKARNFRGSDSLVVPPAALAAISNAVTVSFWQYGSTNQPRNDTCFEGTSDAGRELNAHLPWGDGNVYWDAFGNYDRINKLAATNLYRDGWNHWTFTKDRSTGTMRIYVNGELWHSGTGKTRAYTPATAFRFGSAANGGSGYMGMMDELRIEAVARPPEWIRFQHEVMLDQAFIYGEQQVAIMAAANAAEPGQAGHFVITRFPVGYTNLPLSVKLAAPGGSAYEGVDYQALSRSVTISAGATAATIAVAVMDDFWLEGAETVAVAVAQGDYGVESSNATASIAILDDDEDTDEDGMCDAWEMMKFGNLTQTGMDDPDHDGLPNSVEFAIGTSPTSADTDQNGASDADEDCDHDGVSNLVEYQRGTDPLIADTDGDLMPDKWELDVGLDPLMDDAALDPDNDGLGNYEEYLAQCHPRKFDTDDDGLSDGDEVRVRRTAPLLPDSDRDGMPDKWEVDMGLNPLDPTDAFKDADSDGLTNLDEYLNGTQARVADTDGDGFNDGFEVLSVRSNPGVADFDGTRVVLATSAGDQGTNYVGGWIATNGVAYALETGGSVEYMLSLPGDAICAALVEVTPRSGYVGQAVYDLSAYMDGCSMGRQVVSAAPGTNVNAVYFLPPLAAGAHVLRLQWNQGGGAPLQINSVTLIRYGGPDADTNGAPDWADYRLSTGLTMKPLPTTTFVSPVCVEGVCRIGGNISVEGRDLASSTTVQATVSPGIGDGWYANVTLSPSAPTGIRVFSGDGTMSRTGTVSWLPYNVLEPGAPELMLREGDALLLTAVPSGVTGGVVHIQVVGVTNYEAEVASPVEHRFTQAGIFTLQGAWTDGAEVVTGTVTVKVVGGGFGSNPACWVNHGRSWACPGLPGEAVVEFDPAIQYAAASNPAFGRAYSLNLGAPVTRSILARLGPDGPVMARAEASGFDMLSSGQLCLRVVEEAASGDRLVEVGVLLWPRQPDVNVTIRIFAGGITFDDGSVQKILEPGAFDESGFARVYMIWPAGARTSVCHTYTLWQGGECIGTR